MTTTKTKRLRKSLRYSILDGSAYSAMLGLTDNYIVPFALVLKATTAQIGLLSSVPNLIMSLSQLAAPHLVERAGSRKGLILPAVFLHALTWLPILLIPYLFSEQKIWWLIGFFALNTVLGSLGNPAWGSLMANLVPEKMRGRYFGSRGQICNLANLVFFFIGGAILYFSADYIFIGFCLVFGSAMIFRLASWYFLSRMYEPPLSNTKRECHNLREVLKNMGSSNIGRFIIYVSLINLATNLSSPFFAVYMLRDLKFNYMTYTIITATTTLATMVFLTFWGKRADRAGNIRVLKTTSVLIPLVPLLWMGSHAFYYLIPVQILSGFAWAGFNLASTNFIFDASAPEKRTQYIAAFNALSGTACCVGALSGGYLVSHLPSLFGYQLLTLFLISGLARALVSATLLRHISEVRQVPKVNTVEFLFGTTGYVQLKYALSSLNSRLVGVTKRLHPIAILPVEKAAAKNTAAYREEKTDAKSLQSYRAKI